MFNSKCRLCPLYKNSTHVCLGGEGPISSQAMVIGESPGYSEDREGKLFVGQSGKLLDQILGENSVHRDSLYLTNALKCKLPEKHSPSAKEIKACTNYLQRELNRVKPKYVLLLGAVALKAVLGKAKITEIHGSIIEKNGVKYLPTFHPAMALRDPKRLMPIKHDIEKFIRLINGKPTEQQYELNYKPVRNIDQLKNCILDLHENKKISFDLETTGLDRFNGEVNVLILGTKKYQWVILLNQPGYYTEFKGHTVQQKILKLIHHILVTSEIELIGQNAKFDNLWLMEKYDIRFPLTFDTMLASHLLDENSPNGLKYLTKTILKGPDYYVSLDIKTGKIKSSKKFYTYCASDGFFTRKLRDNFNKTLREDGSLSIVFRQLVMPAARAYEIVESNGVYINIDKMFEVEKEIKKRLTKAKKELDSYIKGEVNWNSSVQVSNILFKKLKLKPQGYTPKGEPSTGHDFLKQMLGQHAIIKPLLKYRGAEKINSSFIEGWKKRLRNGCWLYPSYKIHGTVTGRPSCSDPNLQQAPRDPLIRSLISAPKGWICFEADYSQVELRIAAMLSGDREMLRIFQTGGDIHTATASAVMGIPEEEVTKEDRFRAKAINFGFIYGMGWRKFMEYALNEYGLVLTQEQSKMFRKRFFQKYPGLLPWHARQIRIAHSLEQVRTLTGRIRHLPEISSPDSGLSSQAERNAINSPVQGFAVELSLMSIIELTNTFTNKDIQFFGTVHDAILGRVREDKVNLLHKVRNIMENPSLLDTFQIDMQVPIVVDVSVGDWGNGVSI